MAEGARTGMRRSDRWVRVGRPPMTMWIGRREDLSSDDGLAQEPLVSVLARLDEWLRDPAFRRNLAHLTSSASTHGCDAGALQDGFRSGRLLACREVPRRVIQQVNTIEAVGPELVAEEREDFALQIVEDQSCAPLARVSIRIALPDGKHCDATTDAQGMIQIRDVVRGQCVVAADAPDTSLKATLSVVGTGGLVDVDAKPAGPPPGGQAPPKIGAVVRHRVRRGDTLPKLAADNGVPVPAILKFNFGTTDTNKAYRKLRREVGGQRVDGQWVFDDAEEPGILYIPSPLRLTGLATGALHVVRVAPLVSAPPPFLFSC